MPEDFWEGEYSTARKEAMNKIASIGKETWQDISNTVMALDSLASKGGLSTLKSEIVDMMENSKLGLLTPILNELQPAISAIHEALEPVLPYIAEAIAYIVNLLVPVIQWIADMVEAIINFLKGGEPGGAARILETYNEQRREEARAGSHHGGHTLDRPYGGL